MESIYTQIEQFEQASGKLRWNEICNDIVGVYQDLFAKHEQLYTAVDLWSLLFEPTIMKEKKQTTLGKVMHDEKHAQFFTKLLPFLLQDQFKEVLNLGKTLF
jgi:hypothetical protein